MRLPSGQRYWTVLDEDLSVVVEADAFLRHVRFGRDGSGLTTRAYAGGIALFLRWCARSGRHWHVGVEPVDLDEVARQLRAVIKELADPDDELTTSVAARHRMEGAALALEVLDRVGHGPRS